jgi:hypothetical protein
MRTMSQTRAPAATVVYLASLLLIWPTTMVDLAPPALIWPATTANLAPSSLILRERRTSASRRRPHGWRRAPQRSFALPARGTA